MKKMGNEFYFRHLQSRKDSRYTERTFEERGFNIHSRIRWIYIAPFQGYWIHRSAPDSSTVKNRSFKDRVEYVRVNPQQVHCYRPWSYKYAHGGFRIQPPPNEPDRKCKMGPKSMEKPQEIPPKLFLAALLLSAEKVRLPKLIPAQWMLRTRNSEDYIIIQVASSLSSFLIIQTPDVNCTPLLFDCPPYK